MPALLQKIHTTLPRGETKERLVAVFTERAEMRSTVLLLLLVARIDRHQSGEGPLSRVALRVDGLTERHADRPYGQAIRSLFTGGPKIVRDRVRPGRRPPRRHGGVLGRRPGAGRAAERLDGVMSRAPQAL